MSNNYPIKKLQAILHNHLSHSLLPELIKIIAEYSPYMRYQFYYKKSRLVKFSWAAYHTRGEYNRREARLNGGVGMKYHINLIPFELTELNSNMMHDIWHKIKNDLNFKETKYHDKHGIIDHLKESKYCYIPQSVVSQRILIHYDLLYCLE